MKFRVILLILTAVTVLSSPVSAESHQRDTWYIGFGIGTGFDDAYELDGRDISFDDWLEGTDKGPLLSLNFKAGYTMSPKTLLGFDVTSLGQSGTIGGTTGHIQINNYFLMLTHFPKKEGFFIRAGAGLSILLVYVNTFDALETASGFGVLGGLGYAFWLGKSFNLTLNIDHSRQFYSSSSNKPETSRFTAVYMGFDWY